MILTEIPQGLRPGRETRLVGSRLRSFPILRLDDLEDFVLAGDLYRSARGAGVRFRKTFDCLIAASCLRTSAPLLHADAAFDRLASCTPLRLWSRD